MRRIRAETDLRPHQPCRIVPHSWSLAMRGRSALSVRDAAPDAERARGPRCPDPGSADLPVPDYTRRCTPGSQERIGVCRNHFFGANEGGGGSAGRTGESPIWRCAARR